MKKLFSHRLFSILLLIAILAAVYFINVEVQSYFGRQALEKAGLQNLPLKDSLAKAAAENKLVLVDVSAIWCPNCRRLDTQVFADEAVRKIINEKYLFSRLEYESPEARGFLEKTSAVGFPNLWLLDKDGNVVKHLDITYDPKEFINQLP